jgi:hypothetical protein
MKTKKSVTWKNRKMKKNTKPSFFKRIKGLFTKKNNPLKQKFVFPNTYENVEARKTPIYNKDTNNNNNNNNSARTPRNLIKQHYHNTIAKTMFRGKYFIENNNSTLKNNVNRKQSNNNNNNNRKKFNIKKREFEMPLFKANKN